MERNNIWRPPRIHSWSSIIYHFLNDIFLFTEQIKITNYADDNTPYAIEFDIEKLIESLEHDTNILLTWFKQNQLKSNNDKCHLIIINNEDTIIKLKGEEIEEKKLLNY